jgi:hypothetical protein
MAHSPSLFFLPLALAKINNFGCAYRHHFAKNS